MIDNESLPVSDDVQDQGPTEQELLDAVMANSPIMDEVAPPPLPTEEVSDEVPEESEEAEEEETAEDEAVSEDEEEVETEEDEEEGEDDSSTQEPEAYALDDLDEFSVMVKIDGEESAVNIQELVKGYATEQSLSKKGRELGEARKALEEEREQKMAEIDAVADTANVIVAQAEAGLAKQYNDLEEKIKKARADGDTYELNELKDKREQVQQRYWTARNRREEMMKAVAQQKAELAQQEWDKQLQHFSETIPELVPDFDENKAQDIRQFALDEGMSAELIDSIVDPHAIKMLNDYMTLKKGVKAGAQKRKAVPAKKSVPVKKAKPAAKKVADREKMVKARAFREDASAEDQMDFLRQHASKSLNL